MFLKPIRVKSNSQIKNSERKALKNKIIQKFPVLADSDIEKIFPSKESVFISKIVTHANDVVIVYLVKKHAMLFEHENILYPTVYFLWNFPDLLLCFTTHSTVVSKLMSGADLMLPGVVLPENSEGPSKYGKFEKNTMAVVNTTTNKAAFAIGKTAHSNMDMYMAADRGKCVNILHTYNDYLCQMEGKPLPVPELGPPEWLIKSNSHNETTDDNTTLFDHTEQEIENTEQENNTETNDLVSSLSESLGKTTISSSTEEMDKLLLYCFLKTLKYSGKKFALPILTSNFYRLHIVNACPSGKTIDIKKTKYKKLSKFLSEMRDEQIIKLEQSKGVETILYINFDHPKIKEFYKDKEDISEQELTAEGTSSALNIEETYTVTAAVLPIFSYAGYRKGDSVKSADVRKHITDYVKKKKLNSIENRGIIIPNKELASSIRSEENISWEELMQKIFSLMSSSFQVTTGCSKVSGKGKLEPIVLSVGSRSGNKKVTLVDNLPVYGINPVEFGKECQHGVAASTTVTKKIGKKYEQLLIQGNQVAFVGNLLMEKYNIPKKYIRGLELAVKPKK